MTNIKERILYFIKNQKLKREEFFKNLELSYSNFKGKQKNTGLNSDTIVKILTNYPNLSSDWLLLGKGEMLRDFVYRIDERHNFANEPYGEELIKTQADLIKSLREQNELLREKLGNKGKSHAS